METRQAFLDDFNAQLRELYITTSEAAWMAQTTGDPEWSSKFTEAETNNNLLFSSKEKYEKV